MAWTGCWGIQADRAPCFHFTSLRHQPGFYWSHLEVAENPVTQELWENCSLQLLILLTPWMHAWPWPGTRTLQVHAVDLASVGFLLNTSTSLKTTTKDQSWPSLGNHYYFNCCFSNCTWSEMNCSLLEYIIPHRFSIYTNFLILCWPTQKPFREQE